MKQRVLALAAALCLAVGLAVPAAAAAYPEMTTDYFYTILNSAASSKNGVAVSADGSDVPADRLWVTQAVMDDFQQKLDQAQGYYAVYVEALKTMASYSNTAPDPQTHPEDYLIYTTALSQSKEAEYAALTLQNAIPGFQDARQPGTMGTDSGNSTNPPAPAEEDPEPEPSDEPDITPMPSFSDVAEGDWYFDFVSTVYQKKLFAGFDDGTFRPDDEMTYGQFLAVLSQFAGGVTAGADDEVWYDPYVRWGMESGVLPGALWDGFDPEASVTRQDMAVMFGLFLTEYEVDYDPVNTETASFTDSADIDSYALGGVALCWQAGIMGGRTDGSFGPQDTATRAEVAVTMVQMARVMDR